MFEDDSSSDAFSSLSRIKRTSHRVVYAAAKILGDMTHEEIESFYNKSGVFNLHGHD